jgi:glycosyltransferase involved in cell wall biosynthesis
VTPLAVGARATKTVLFLTPRMIVGGAERYLLEKVAWLVRHQHRAIVVSEGGVWEPEVEKRGGRHHTLGFVGTDPYLFNRSAFLKNLVRLNAIVEREQVSIVEASHLAPALWGHHLSRLFGVPAFLNVLAGREFYEGKSAYTAFLQALDAKGLYYNSETSNRLIEAKKKVRLPRCVEIPIPVVGGPPAPPLQPGSTGRFVLTVCRMAPEKLYVRALIRDFGRLMRKRPGDDLRLVVVGDGPCRRQVQALAEKVNRRLGRPDAVELKGTVVGPALDALFAGCLFYVGMGTTVLQAARAGKCSVLATDEKRHRTRSPAFFADGQASTGFRLPEMKLASFHQRMKELLAHPGLRQALEAKSAALCRETFEAEAVMHRWLEEYDRLIAAFGVYGFTRLGRMVELGGPLGRMARLSQRGLTRLRAWVE